MPDERRISTSPVVVLPLGDLPPPYEPGAPPPPYPFATHQVVTVQPLSAFAGPVEHARSQRDALDFFCGSVCATLSGVDGSLALAAAGGLCFSHSVPGITAALASGVVGGTLGFSVHAMLAHKFCKSVESSEME